MIVIIIITIIIIIVIIIIYIVGTRSLACHEVDFAGPSCRPTNRPWKPS